MGLWEAGGSPTQGDLGICEAPHVPLGPLACPVTMPSCLLLFLRRLFFPPFGPTPVLPFLPLLGAFLTSVALFFTLLLSWIYSISGLPFCFLQSPPSLTSRSFLSFSFAHFSFHALPPALCPSSLPPFLLQLRLPSPTLTSCPPLCSCPRRPLADPPLLPRLPGWFQRALRPPGEPRGHRVPLCMPGGAGL